METFIGTVFDKSSEEVDFLSFEYELSEYSEWNFVKVNSTNVDDENDILNPENPQETDDEQTGGHILVPEECLNVCESKFSKDFNISAMSSLVIEFNLFVLGYNVSNESSILNPIFKIIFKDLESEKEMNVMDISRLGVTDGEWNSRQFAVEVQEERSIKVTFQLSTGGGAGNEIALDDVQISWIPVMASEVRNDHVNVLFTTPSPSTTTSTSTTATTSTTPASTLTTTVSTTTQNSENATTVENNETTTTATTTATSTTTTPIIITTTTEQVTEAPQTNQTEGTPTNSTTTSTSTTSTNTTTESPSEETNSTTTTESPSEETNSTTTTESPSEETNTTTTTLSPSEETNTTTITMSSSKETTTESPSETMNTTSTTTTITPTTAKEMNETVTTPNVETNQTTTTIKPTSTTSSTIASTESITNSSAVITDNPEAQEHAAQMAHSYTVQVILICLVVMFGCLFLFMIVKYYRLRTSIGDYRLQHGNGGGPSRQTYDNPAFDGFGVQDSYRSR